MTRWGTPGIDVAAGVRAQLERAGVVLVEAPGWCTVEDRRFFSYRREGAIVGVCGVLSIMGDTDPDDSDAQIPLPPR